MIWCDNYHDLVLQRTHQVLLCPELYPQYAFCLEHISPALYMILFHATCSLLRYLLHRDGCISFIIKGLLCWIRMCLFWAARVQPEILWFWKLGEFLLGLSSERKFLSAIRQVPWKEMTRGVCKHWEDRASGAGRGDRCHQGQVCWNGCILSGTLWWSN